MSATDLNLLKMALAMLKCLVNGRLYINKALFCRKIMLLEMQQYSYLTFFDHRGQRRLKTECAFAKTADSMCFASQFLSEAMRSEVHTSDLMSDCALVSMLDKVTN